VLEGWRVGARRSRIQDFFPPLVGGILRRQQQIGNYITDFVCFEKGLIIELDGGQHALDIEKDKQRDDWLRSEGFEVVRFWNTDIFENIEGLMEAIRNRLLTPSLSPSHEGREDGKKNLA